jgi:hypothetical protein
MSSLASQTMVVLTTTYLKDRLTTSHTKTSLQKMSCLHKMEQPLTMTPWNVTSVQFVVLLFATIARASLAALIIFMNSASYGGRCSANLLYAQRVDIHLRVFDDQMDLWSLCPAWVVIRQMEVSTKWKTSGVVFAKMSFTIAHRA